MKRHTREKKKTRTAIFNIGYKKKNQRLRKTYLYDNMSNVSRRYKIT